MISSALIGSVFLVHLTLLSGPELKRQVDPSVFLLSVGLRSGESFGTGFLISEAGWMVTNNHVIDGAVSIVARNDAGEEFPVKPGFYARDADHDLAIIQLDLERAPAGFRPQPVSLAPDTQDLSVGFELYVLGHPGGEKIAEFTRGNLTAIEPDPRRLRFDASIHRGSSGSPLFDARNGQVIGVVYSYWTGAAKLNYATPVDYLHEVLASIGSEPRLVPYRRPALSRAPEGKSTGVPMNLVLSLGFFVVVILAVRRILAAAHR